MPETDWNKLFSQIDEILANVAATTGPRAMTDAEKGDILALIDMLTGGAEIPESKMAEIDQLIVQASEANALKSTANSDWEEIDQQIALIEASELGYEVQGSDATSIPTSVYGAIGVADRIAKMTPIHTGYMFHVAIGADAVGDFQQVEGLSKSVEYEEYWEGGKNDAPHLLMNKGSVGEVTLRWGLLWRTALWDWMKAVKVGTGFKKHVTIMQLDRKRIPLRVYFLKNCVPTSYTAPPLDTSNSNVALESISLKFEEMYEFANPLLAVNLF